MDIRPQSKVPETGRSIDKAQLDAAVAHENNITYYLDKTELGVVDEMQQAIESLLTAYDAAGLHLPAATRFFTRQRELSSGVKGIGRVQAKEIITAGQFPLSLLFDNQKPGWIDTIKGIFGRSQNNPPQQQQGAR